LFPNVKTRIDSREVWGGQLNKSGRLRWPSVVQGVLNRDRKTTQMVSKLVPTDKWEDITETSISKSNTEDIVEHLDPSKTISQKKRVYERVNVEENVGKGGIYWRGPYSGKKHGVGGKSEEIEIDHIVSIQRARESGKFKTLSQKHEFYANMKNLVAASKEMNQAKKGYGLSKWVPALKPQREAYAKKYHAVFKHYGMKFTWDEGQKYQEITGMLPEVEVMRSRPTSKWGGPKKYKIQESYGSGR